MDLKEEKNILVSENMEEIDREMKTESIGSPSISPIMNNNEIGGNNPNSSPKSFESSSDVNFDKEIVKNLVFGSKNEENTGEMGIVNDSNINHINEESNEPRVSNNEIGNTQSSELSPNSREPSKTKLDVNSKPVKGYGLKKWRRIRRELNKDATGSADSSIVLKRQHSHTEPSKRHDNSKSKIIIEEDVENPTKLNVETIDFHKLGELRGFSIGAISDNNDDQSSKSSSAASVNKPRHETGFGRERARMKNVGLQQRVQRGRSDVTNVGQNTRCDRLRLEKENSSSSIESSSNTNFLRRESGISNGKKSEIGVLDEVESLKSHESNDGRKSAKESMRTSSGVDHFVGSIAMLQAAQEALETEIQNFEEILKAATVDEFDFDEQSEDIEVNSSSKSDDLVSELKQKIEQLNYKLEEASMAIKAKDSKVLELENLVKKTSNSELEFEDLIKKRIEAEIEILILDNATRNWKIIAEDQIALLDEKLSKLKDAEDETTKLKGRAEKLDSYCKELLGSELEALKIKTKIYKFSFCSFIQLILLWLAIWFLIQLMPPSDEFVPT